MKPEITQTILNFLARVDLKGNEAIVFTQCVQELNKLLDDKKESIDKVKGSVSKG